MNKISRFLIRSIGVWIVLLGLGSLLVASRYSDGQARTFRETLLSQHPEMEVREVLALTNRFSSANQTIIWIMTGTSFLWICITALLAFACPKETRARPEPGAPPSGSPAAQPGIPKDTEVHDQ